jgi:hypothetical protein
VRIHSYKCCRPACGLVQSSGGRCESFVHIHQVVTELVFVETVVGNVNDL